MQNTQSNLMLKKREIFRISIRRQQHEEIFKAKRFGQGFQNLDNDWQTPQESLLSKARQIGLIHDPKDSLQEIFKSFAKIISNDGIYFNKELQNFLSFLFFHLQYMLPNNEDNWINEQFISIIEASLACILQNFYEQEENYEEEIKLSTNLSEILRNVLVFIAKLSSQLDISKMSQNFEKILKKVIELLHYINDIELFEVVGKLLNNILKEKSEFYQKILEESTCVLILMEKYTSMKLQQNCQIAYQIYLYLSWLTDYQSDQFGTIIFKDTYALSQILQDYSQDKDNNYHLCLQEYLNFLSNISNQIEKNKPKQYQLFNILIDKQIVLLVVDVLMNVNTSQKQIIHYGYKFLQNLSMISSSYSMEQLINQNVFSLIIFQINDENYPQQLLYPLLSNLLATNKKSTKDNIFDSGILGRVLIGFQNALENQYKNLIEITQCIINMFSDINQQQQLLLIQKSMLQCLLDYIIFVDIDQLDIRTCEEIYLTLEEQKQMNHEIELNQQFIHKSKLIYQAISDDDNNISCSINNLIDITE